MFGTAVDKKSDSWMIIVIMGSIKTAMQLFLGLMGVAVNNFYILPEVDRPGTPQQENWVSSSYDIFRSVNH